MPSAHWVQAWRMWSCWHCRESNPRKWTWCRNCGAVR